MKTLVKSPTLSLMALFASLVPFTQAVAGNLKPGDIVYADSGNAIEGGFLVKVDPDTGTQTVLSSGGHLNLPVDPVLGHQGEIFVSDTSGKLIGIDPETAGQTVIMDNSHGKLGVPFGIALGSNGDVFIANMQAIVCFNRKLGETTTVSAGAKLVVPIWVAMDNDGELFVLNRGVSNNIVAIDRKTGDQTIIAEGFNSPQALVLTKETIYVTDVATPDGNFGVGRIVAVDRQTGAQWEVSKEGLLKRPVGIAVDGKGRLIVGDPYTPHPAQPDLLQGAILRIDPVNGDQEVIAWGQAGFINPRGVAVVPGVRALGKAD